ncbi:hypothetical protein F5J12DRAFT_306048 [Pisolithus orientalis]|uniref:uncharacterized protein n=1 Tax=Pisolithus orientalis TaxID=936130 RepID=UPI0022252C9B|nr:uncharacterized protein F5J12DRAFT_306048 [Pisolithus orientalis]KAI6030729.1 hypothetical protein F5J12DRAFT_306048 [Pisolithus orientalis]
MIMTKLNYLSILRTLAPVHHATPTASTPLPDADVAGEGEGSAQAVSYWRDESQRAPAAGDSGVSSSAQVVVEREHEHAEDDVSEEAARNAFTFYDSPLTAYPLLRSRLEPASGDTGGHHSAIEAPLAASSVSFPFRGALSRMAHASIPMMLPDLKPLKQAILLRRLTEMTAGDASIRVCQYEVPGGGTCRNDECEELHLSRISCEPSDAEVAAYVHSRLSSPWRGRCDARAIAIGLESVRLRAGGTGDLDADVVTALSELGVPATPGDDNDDIRVSITTGKSAERHRRAM